MIYLEMTCIRKVRKNTGLVKERVTVPPLGICFAPLRYYCVKGAGINNPAWMLIMVEDAMKKDKTKHGWLWLFLLIVVLLLAGLVAYLMFLEKEEESGNDLALKKASPVETKPASEKEPQVIEEKTAAPEEEEKTALPPLSEEEYCIQIQNDVAGFFRYLDQKEYIKRFHLRKGTYSYFRKMLNRLVLRPPVPAGEGNDHEIMVRNLYLFFRILKPKDLNFARSVLNNEQDTMETTMELFYNWFMLPESCPDTGKLRPSSNITYKYAGYLLNTTGGRAYLFRRKTSFRLLATYYSLLIVHEADKTGKNRYGIDIFPLITPLINEFSHYPDFHFQNEYISRLINLKDYYEQKR